jgi:hypothetical protein
MQLARKIVASTVFISIAVMAAAGIYGYLREQPLDSKLRFNSMSGTKYRIVFDSFDPDSKVVQAHASVELFNDAAYFTDKTFFSSIGIIHPKDVKLSYGPISFEDLGERVNDSGLIVAQFDENIYPSAPDANYGESFPPIARCELHALGNTSLFPFDKYLVLGKIWSDIFVEKTNATKTEKDRFVRLDMESFGIDFRLPGYFARPALQSELAVFRKGDEGRTFNPQELAIYQKGRQGQPYDPQTWSHNRFAIALQRPLFLRVLTLVLLIVAVCSIVAIGMTSDSKQFVINSASYFLALWAIRGVLEVGAPKTPTIVDYSVLGLYATLVALMLAKLIWGFTRA